MGFGGGRQERAEEHLIETFHAEKIEQAVRSADHVDAMRQGGGRGGYGRWLAILIGAAGIVALFLALYLLAGLP